MTSNAASPFELPVTELELDLHWRVPVAHPDPTVVLSAWLRFQLWRGLCEQGRRGLIACAVSAKATGSEPLCARLPHCLAHQAMPLPGSAQPHETPLVLVHPAPGYPPEPRWCRVHIKLFGRRAGPRWAGHVLTALQGLLRARGGAHQGGFQATAVEWMSERRYTLQEASARLAGAQQWRVELLSAWSASHTHLGLGQQPCQHWLQQFPALVAQRAKKLVALDMADRRREGLPALDGETCHELGLRARDEAAWPALAGLQAIEHHLELEHIRRDSRSNGESKPLHLLRGSFVIQAPRARGAAGRLAPWLAMLEAMGGGGDTAKGHGAVGLVPLGGPPL